MDNSNEAHSRQFDIQTDGLTVIWENVDTTTSAQPTRQFDIQTDGLTVIWENVDKTASAQPTRQFDIQTDGLTVIWDNADSENEGHSYGAEDAQPCVKEVASLKARIATYKDFICDLVHKELQHATEAGWTPAVLNILKKTAEELDTLSAEA